MRFIVSCTVISALALPPAAAAQAFTPYPGSTFDQAASDAAAKAGGGSMRVGVYVTPDPFDKVVAFYKARYKEIACGNPPALPNGQRVRWACFALDGAANLWTSKSWMKVQRPYVGQVSFQGGPAQFNDVRDATVIETVVKR